MSLLNFWIKIAVSPAARRILLSLLTLLLVTCLCLSLMAVAGAASLLFN